MESVKVINVIRQNKVELNKSPKTPSNNKFKDALNGSLNSEEKAKFKSELSKLKDKSDIKELKDGQKEEPPKDIIEEPVIKVDSDINEDSKGEIEGLLSKLEELLASLNLPKENSELLIKGDLNKNLEVLDVNSKVRSFLEAFTDLVTELKENPQAANNLPEVKAFDKVMNMLSEVKGEEKTHIEDLLSKLINKLGNSPVKDSSTSLILNSLKEKLNLEKADSRPKEINNFKPIIRELDIKQTSDLNVQKSKESQEDSKLESLIKGKESNVFNKAVLFSNHVFNVRENPQEIPTEGNLVVNKMTFKEDVIKAVKFMDLNDLKELTVKIKPKELGHMVISLTMEAGIMKAKISADSKETYNLLNSNLMDLKNSLENSNLKVQELQVNIQTGDSTTFGQFTGGFTGEERSSSNNKNKSFRAEDNVENTMDDNDIEIDSNINILA